MVGPEVRTGNLTLRLVEVEADAEAVISGSLKPETIRFYTFADVPFVKQFKLYPKERCVVFLREEAGLLRTMADLDRSEIPVYSGLHSTSDLPDARSVAARVMPCVHSQLGGDSLTAMRVAYVALTPGQNSAPELLIAGVRNVGKLWSMAPSPYVVWLLRQLQTNRDRGVRDEACIALAESPAGAGADQCLLQVANGPDSERAKRALNLLRVHEQDRVRLVETLKGWPGSLSPDVVDLAGRLELLTSHKNQEVRHLACRALGNLFPACAHGGCGSGGAEATGASTGAIH
jgi:hypothetical protein